jgi:hypothetical protein
MWFLRRPEKLVLPQGRITVINSASNYVTLDSAGEDLSTQSDNLQSYINFVDGQTGEIKGSAQIQILANNRVTIRTSPIRTSVLGRTISDGISDITGLELDDYVCLAEGTCVPYFGEQVSNFLIQFAVAEITRKLGGTADTEERVLEKFEQQVERTWVGREQQLRVKKRSHAWGRPIRRLYWE